MNPINASPEAVRESGRTTGDHSETASPANSNATTSNVVSGADHSPDSRPTMQPESQVRPALADENYAFVQVNDFQPNVDGWNLFGHVVRYQRIDDRALRFENADGYALQLSFLSPTGLRVQFRPEVRPNYDLSAATYAVPASSAHRRLAPVQLVVREIDRGGRTLEIKTESMTVYIGLEPWGMAIERDGQLVTEDTYGKNLIFSNRAVACLRKAPQNENYFGFGEKAGSHLNKKYFTMTCFNYDNFTYGGQSVIPPGNDPGPLNPSEPLYNSMPFTVAVGTSSGAPGAGGPTEGYAYGLFLDNVSQSYFNMGSNDYSDMSGKYYFGALYGDLDYYLLVGEGPTSEAVRSVLRQYAELTGSSAMPPKYAFGYQQGCYGYYSKDILLEVARQFRESQIPIDGLHIDVDFQDNYRTFTSSQLKFPDAGAMFDDLHARGFKCSTNVTGIISANPLDENGNRNSPYPARDQWVRIEDDNSIEVLKQDPPFLYDTPAVVSQPLRRVHEVVSGTVPLRRTRSNALPQVHRATLSFDSAFLRRDVRKHSNGCADLSCALRQ